MAYQLPEKWSIESLLDHSVTIQAGLGALELDPLAPPWAAIESDLTAARTARDAARKKVVMAAAVVRVRHAKWGAALTSVSSRSYELAGKKSGKPPHSVLFDTTPAAQAKKFGPDRGVPFGTTLAGKAKALGVPALDEKVTPFLAENQALSAVSGVHAQAESEALAHEAVRVTLHGKVEAQIAMTEAAILSQHPGRDDLVRAVLSPYNERKKKKTE